MSENKTLGTRDPRRNKKEITALGKAVKLQAIKMGKTLSEVAEEAGMPNRTYLSQIMRGDKKNSKYLPIVARILNINLDKYIA